MDALLNTEQQLFLSSFYCYLSYHPTNDFVIDLDDVWEWLGFSQKVNARSLLEKNFIIDKDYIGRGCFNKEPIMLNIKTFKALCLKAGTKKAYETHEYYLKMEDMSKDVIFVVQADRKRISIELRKNH